METHQSKTCKQCNLDKPLTEYWKSANKSGYEATCRQCRMLTRYEQERERSKKNGAAPRIPTLEARRLREAGLKYCPGCCLTKPVDEFYTSGESNSGRASHCIPCSNELGQSRPKEERQKIYQRDKEKVRAYQLKQKFGISVEEYERLLAEQNGVCAICGGNDKGKRLAVDHCHETGKVRSLLCGRCNPAVGFLLEDIELANKVLAYIEKHKGK